MRYDASFDSKGKSTFGVFADASFAFAQGLISQLGSKAVQRIQSYDFRNQSD